MKKLIPLATAATIAVVLAGCTTAPSSTETPDAKPGGVITFTGQTQEQELWEGLFSAFEDANPGYTVDATYTPNDGYPQLVQTQLQSGQAADVIQSSPGTGGPLAALNLAAGGRLADLSDTAWAPELPTSLSPLVSLDGKVYAYPTDLAPLMPVYNPDIFKDLGVKVPTTFQQLLDACGTISAAGIIPIALAGGSFQNVTITLQALAANEVFGPDPEWNSKRADGDTTFVDSKGWQQVLKDFQAMIDAGCYAPDVAAVQAPVHIQQFASGQAAMVIIPAQGIGIVRANATPDLSLSTFALPARKAADTRVAASSGISLVVNADAADPAAARVLLDFLSSPEEKIAYADKAGTIAPGAGADGADVVPEFLEPLNDYLTPEKSLPLYYLSWPSGAVTQQLSTSAQGLFTGQKTIDQVLQDVDKAWDEAQ